MTPTAGQTAGPTGVPPPRALVATALVALVVCSVLAVHGAATTGVTTDEPIHVMRLRNYLTTGWYALDWDYVGAGPGGPGTNTFVYAPVTMLVLHAWSSLWGVEDWGTVATTPQAYTVRHLGVVVLAAVGVVAVAALGRLALRRWSWGVVAAGILVALPLWTGYAMYNVKDVPVATGYTLVTLGLAWQVRSTRPSPAARLTAGACLVLGLVLALGTRPGLWPGVLASLVATAVAVVLAARDGSGAGTAAGRLRARAAVDVVVSCVAAAAALVALYPRLFGDPLTALPRTSESSSSFMAGAKSDRLYVPTHVVQELPTLLLAFVVIGAVAVVWGARRWWRPPSVGVPDLRLLVVAVQLTALPLAAVVAGSDLYHGLRQLLFAAPAAAVLAAHGMSRALRPAAPARQPVRRRVAKAAAVLALLLPVADQVTLQPYQTTYVNFATDLATAPGHDATERRSGDYWRVSLPELVAGRSPDRLLLCKSTIDELSGLAYSYADASEAFSTSRSIDCRAEANGPLAPLGLPVPTDPRRGFEAAFLGPVPANCVPRAEVSRWRHGFGVVLSTLARCTDELVEVPTGGLRADSALLGTALPGDLWRATVDGWEQWPGRPMLSSPVRRATLAFAVPHPCPAPCTLELSGRVPADLEVTRQGRPVSLAPADGAVRLRLGDLGAGDVWLRLARASGQPLDLDLTGLSWWRPRRGAS